MKMMNNLMHYVYNKTIFKTVSLKCNANVKSMTGSKSRILKQFHYVVEEDYKAYGYHQSLFLQIACLIVKLKDRLFDG
jgi:hypothetical protein